MKETQAIIQQIKQVNQTHQHLTLSVDASYNQLKPGQYTLARTHETWHPYLREAWLPVALSKGRLVVERPLTETYESGQVVDLLGIVGQPYRFRRTLRNVLLMVYDTAPTPLLMTIPWLLGNQVAVTLLLLGKATEYKTAHLPEEVEVIHGTVKVEADHTDFHWPSRVTTVGWADQVFVVVPQEGEMQHFARILALFEELQADVPKLYLFGVFRMLQPCGTGACHACMVRTNDGDKLICVEGPALDLKGVKLR